jgi:integrase
LRWTCPETGKRKNLALGVDESPTGRAYAATIKDRIESDARHGYYDPSLVKYRPKTIGKNPTEITTVELFDLFTQHQAKHQGLSKASIDTRYKYLKVMLEKHKLAKFSSKESG